jgi:hypothetical protein
MSIFKSLVEQASATIPFDQARPVRSYDDYKRSDSRQQLVEQQEREREIEDEQFMCKIEGLAGSGKKKRKIEEVVVKTKSSGLPSFMEDDTSINKVTTEEFKRPATSNIGLFSSICQKSESKEEGSMKFSKRDDESKIEFPDEPKVKDESLTVKKKKKKKTS